MSDLFEGEVSGWFNKDNLAKCIKHYLHLKGLDRRSYKVFSRLK